MKMNIKKGKISIVLIVVVVLLSLTFNHALANKTPLIAYSQCTMNHPWRVAQNNDMIYWAEKMGCDFIWTDGNNDAANQLADCESLIAKKPDVLMMCPLQAKALTPVLEMCNEAGVPLLIVDRNIDAEPSGMFFTYITLDQVEEGRSAARAIVKKLIEKFGEPRGNVVIVTGTIGASCTIERMQGYHEIIDQYPDIKNIATQSGDFLREPAMKITEDWLQVFPKGKIDIVYSHDDEMTMGIINAIKNAGRDELLGYIASQDGMREGFKAMVDGYVFVNVANLPYFGESSFKAALKYLNGEPQPSVQYVENIVFDTFSPESRRQVQEYYNYLLANDLYY